VVYAPINSLLPSFLENSKRTLALWYSGAASLLWWRERPSDILTACAVFILICATTIIANPSRFPQSPATTIENSIYGVFPADISTLPKANVSLKIEDNVAGTSVLAILHFGFISDIDSIAVGFTRYPLVIVNGEDAIPVTGISYSQMAEFPFAYVNEKAIFESWLSGVPDAVSTNPEHPSPVWTQDSQEGEYIGPIWNENVSQLTMVGYVIEISNLTVCIADETSISIQASRIAIGMNFTRVNDEWEPSLILRVSDDQGITASLSEVALGVDGSFPIDRNFTTTTTVDGAAQLIMTIPAWSIVVSVATVVVIVGIAIHRRRGPIIIDDLI
jgi:hypothetical protein